MSFMFKTFNTCTVSTKHIYNVLVDYFIKLSSTLRSFYSNQIHSFIALKNSIYVFLVLLNKPSVNVFQRICTTLINKQISGYDYVIIGHWGFTN